MDIRPIDANAFIEELKDEAANLYLNGLKGTHRDYRGLYDIVDRIGEQPTLDDYAPVRRGTWWHCHRPPGKVTITGSMQCSVCKHSFWRITGTWFTYCPHCGARMDLGAK